MNVIIYRSTTGWRWTIRAGNGRIIGASTEGYVKRSAAERNLEMITNGTLTDVIGALWLRRGPGSNIQPNMMVRVETGHRA